MAETTAGKEEWTRAYRFDDMDAAGAAYSRARDIIFRHDIDASAFRVLVVEIPHVVVLGDGPIDSRIEQQLERALGAGVSANLPTEVQQHLVERRAEGKIPGVFWERRRL